MMIHQPALINRAILIAVIMVIPRESYIRTNTRLIIKGIQLPIYPQAYPLEETESIRSGVVMSVSMES